MKTYSQNCENSNAPVQAACQQPADAFIRVELLVVLCIVALLAAVVVPKQARAKSGGQALQCLNNLRQSIAAYSMYYLDSEDRRGDALGILVLDGVACPIA